MYQAAIYNETYGNEWLGTISQERFYIGRDFAKNAIKFAINEMAMGCCDCSKVTIHIGTGYDPEGIGMDPIFDIFLTTRVEGANIYIDVRYMYETKLHYVRELVMAE